MAGVVKDQLVKAIAQVKATRTELEERAAKTPGLPEGWLPFRFDRIHGGVLCTGAVTREVYTRGPRKGEPNFRRRDRSTECQVFVGPDTRRATIEEYLNRLAANIQHLKMTFLQREMLKAALRTLIPMTPVEP